LNLLSTCAKSPTLSQPTQLLSDPRSKTDAVATQAAHPRKSSRASIFVAQEFDNKGAAQLPTKPAQPLRRHRRRKYFLAPVGKCSDAKSIQQLRTPDALAPHVRRNATGGNLTGDEFTSLLIINEHVEKSGYQLGTNGDAFR
jgi:hypothetical protein